MKKKKKTKKKENFDLLKSRMATLEWVKLKAEVTKEECESLLKKIELNGLDAYYSTNSDILRHATDIWKGCIRLSELKKISDELKE